MIFIEGGTLDGKEEYDNDIKHLIGVIDSIVLADVINTKAGFDPNQPRDKDGKWGSVGDFDDTALEFYTLSNGDPEKLNECLRNDCKDEHWRGIAKSIDDSLTYLDDYKGQTFRGYAIDEKELEAFIEKLKNNDVLFKAFMSSTPDPDVAWGFAKSNVRGEVPIILTLLGKKGKDISKYSVYGSDEQEVLFGTNSRWAVKKHFWENYTDSRKTKFYYIELEQI